MTARQHVASLPPSALRADTSLAEGGFGSRILTPVTAGHTGPALQGAAALLGRTESSAPTKQNKTRVKRDVEDAVPYGA